MLVESHHAQFISADLDYLKEARQFHYQFVDQAVEAVRDMDATAATAYLTQQNHAMTQAMADRTKHLIEDLIMHGLELSQLTFKMDENL